MCQIKWLIFMLEMSLDTATYSQTDVSYPTCQLYPKYSRENVRRFYKCSYSCLARFLSVDRSQHPIETEKSIEVAEKVDEKQDEGADAKAGGRGQTSIRNHNSQLPNRTQISTASRSPLKPK
jgi:hypothetical protein